MPTFILLTWIDASLRLPPLQVEADPPDGEAIGEGKALARLRADTPCGWPPGTLVRRQQATQIALTEEVVRGGLPNASATPLLTIVAMLLPMVGAAPDLPQPALV